MEKHMYNGSCQVCIGMYDGSLRLVDVEVIIKQATEGKGVTLTLTEKVTQPYCAQCPARNLRTVTNGGCSLGSSFIGWSNHRMVNHRMVQTMVELRLFGGKHVLV